MTADAVRAATDAQGRASNPEVSAWVSASAGSGKTRVLVDRVIRLMLAGTPPERILCLTFTRAAAAEMANRLFQTLSGWVGLDDEALSASIGRLTGATPGSFDLVTARRLFTRALETPGGLKIQTIHAFCEKLLQRFPVEAGIVPGFEVMDERAADEMLREVRDGFMRQAGENPETLPAQAFATVVAYVGVAGFDKVMKEVLAARASLLKLLDTAIFQDSFVRLERHLGLAPDDTFENVAQELFEGANRPALTRARDVLAASSAKMKAQAQHLAAFLAAPDPQTAFAAARQLFLTAEEKPKADSTLVTATVANAHPDVAEALFAERDRVLALIDRERCVHVRQASEALLLVALAMLGEYEARKRRHGRYDYEDLIERTLSLLTDIDSAGWVLFKLDGGIDHILVDEAQDTSPPQWQIIAAIVEEFFAGQGARDDALRTLFVVGDHKQSIYSFQGADPQVFDDMHRAFRRRARAAGRRFEDVPLSVSFRSTADVLQAVDRVFAQLDAQAGLTPRGGELLPHQPTRIGQAGLVEIWPKVQPLPKPPTTPWQAPVDHEDAAHPRVRLAERIADTIHRWLAQGELLTSQQRPIRAGDILVLVRRRDRFVDALLRGLKQRGVPVAGADRLVLTDHIAVKDLIALGRFVLLPEDDLNLACLLKSPLVARDDGRPLDDDDLMALCHDRAGSLWQALQRKAGISGYPYGNALERLRTWFNRADFQSPFAFFSQVLGADRGRAAFARRLGDEVHDPLDEFLRATLDYEQTHTPSLQGFLQWLTSAETVIKRDMEHGVDAVRIMTVHGSKGLEANIVFLPDTCSPPRKQDHPQIVAFPPDEAGDAIHCWRLGPAYEGRAIEQLRQRQHQLFTEEYNRLLYVAMTRARDRLYICGYEGVRQASGTTWYDLITAALKPHAREVTLADGEKVWRIESPQTAPVPETGSENGERVAADLLPEWAKRPAPREAPTHVDLAPSHLGEGGDAASAPPAEPSPLAIAADRTRFRRGRLIHRLLEALPALAPKARAAAARRYLARAAADLAEAEREAIWAEVRAILDHREFADVFAPGSLSEVPLAALDPEAGARLTGRVDRLAITETQVLVIDYKTNRPPPLSIDDVDPIYVRQLETYGAILRRIFPEKRVRCALLWTVGARLMELPGPA
ncbi:double-strand break repair helicase AddA [Rhodoligotrophos defluvii]|uniref:double-strand break repair helicase AddA n=1 Tax=Rhodoligotrophos defluvii TaxID=2561934 RepID=UPI0010C961B8|nr:double-strand break repair helicase AddA [Rhodoligotrophos defluvii]